MTTRSPGIKSLPSVPRALLPQYPSLHSAGTGSWKPRRAVFESDTTCPADWPPNQATIEMPADGAHKRAMYALQDEALALLAEVGSGSRADQEAVCLEKGKRFARLLQATDEHQLRAPQTHCTQVGPIAFADGSINKKGTLPEASLAEAEVAVATGFPVHDTHIWASSSKTGAAGPEGPPFSASVLNDVEHAYAGSALDKLFWIDLNPIPRHYSEQTNLTNTLESEAFDLTIDILAQLAPRLLWVCQKDNTNRIVDQLAPTHCRARLDNATQYTWKRYKQGVNWRDWVPMSREQVERWWIANVLDSSILLPYQPASLFVRGWQGGQSMFIMFSPHHSALNSVAVPASFSILVDEFERCSLAVGALFDGRDSDSHKSWAEARVEGRPTTFQESLSIFSSEFVNLFCLGGREMEVIEGFKRLRAMEKGTGQAIAPQKMHPRMRAYLAEKLIPGQPVERLETLVPFHTGARADPPSLIGNMLSRFTQGKLVALAKYESTPYEDLETVEQIILDNARADEGWFKKLTSKFGLSAQQALSEARFGLALPVQKSQIAHSQTHRQRVAHQIGCTQFRDGTHLHFWSPHPPSDNNGHKIVMRLSCGFLAKRSSGDRGRARYQVDGLHTNGSNEVFAPAADPPCTTCFSQGYKFCVYLYDTAIRSGLVKGAAGAKNEQLGLQAWVGGSDKPGLEREHDRYVALAAGIESGGSGGDADE